MVRFQFREYVRSGMARVQDDENHFTRFHELMDLVNNKGINRTPFHQLDVGAAAKPARSRKRKAARTT